MNGIIKEYITDARTYDYDVACGSSYVGSTYPNEYEIPRENTGTLKNQGTISACVACAISSLAEVLFKDKELGEISEGYTYGTLRKDNTNGEGMIVSQALDLWRTLGILPKKYFDILYEMPEMKEIVKKFPELQEIAANNTINSYVTLNWADRNKRDLAIKDALTKYCYGLIAVSHNGFSGGSHCILLTGWNDNNGTYKFKNSWGKKYGDNGFSEISKDKINEVYLVLVDDLKLPFTDVKEGDWFYKYVKNMYFNGVMQGTSDTTFEPDKPLTRAEAATLFYRIMKLYDERFSVLNKVLDEKYGND